MTTRQTRSAPGHTIFAFSAIMSMRSKYGAVPLAQIANNKETVFHGVIVVKRERHTCCEGLEGKIHQRTTLDAHASASG
jgi:hypothetical protein